MSSSAPPPPPPEPTGPGYQPPAGPPAEGGYSPPSSSPMGTGAPGSNPSTGSTPPSGVGQPTSGSRPNPLTGLHQYDTGLLIAGALIFVLSFLPFYTAEGFGARLSENAWESFWSWFPVLLGLAATAMILLPRLGITLPVPTRLVALACWALALLFLIIALLTWPYGGDVPDEMKDAVDEATGHGFGLYASLVVAAIATALAFMRKDATDDATVH